MTASFWRTATALAFLASTVCFGLAVTPSSAVPGAPDATIDSGPPDPSNSASATFTFSSPDLTTVSFECKVDGPEGAGSYEGCSSPKTYSGLSEGLHTFSVRAVDITTNTGPPASQSWTIDLTPPGTTIDSGPSGLTTDDTPSFSFSSGEGGATFECKLDGPGASTGSYGACTSPRSYGPLADGSYTLSVRAKDGAGNVDPSPPTRAFSVDTAPPSTSIGSGPSGLTTDNTPSFTFSSGDGGATFECKLDGPGAATGSYGACTSPKSYGPLADGAYTVSVRAKDAAGNLDPSPATRSFTLDTAAPDTTIDSGPSGVSNDSTPSFSFSSGDAGASFECKLDGPGAATGSYGACTSPKSYGPLADGAYTVSVRAKDAAGNLDPSPANRSFTLDTGAPDTTILTGPSGPTNNNTPTFTFSSGDGSATFECKLDGPGATTGAYGACTSPKSYGPLADGSYTFSVRAKDGAGNVDPSPPTRAFTLDTAPPSTSIDSGPAGPTTDTTPTFTFSSANGGVSFECRVDATAFAPCSSPHTTASLTDGPHTFYARSRDAAGNLEPSPASRSFTVDTSAPDTSIGSGPSGLTNNNTPSFTFSSGDAGATFECKLDGPGAATGTFAACTSSKSYGPLGDGAYTFSVRAKDGAGNTDASPSTRSFTIDTGPPDTTILTGPSGLTNDNTPSFTFSSGDAGASFECKLDGPGAATGTFAACISPKSYGPLGDGAYTLSVRAKDAASNLDSSPASRSFTVDTSAPGATILSGPSGLTNDSTPTYTFSSGDAGATFECKLDGPGAATGTFAACASPKSYGPLGDGAYTFSVRAKDGAGNVGAPASHSLTVDASAPQTTISSGPSGSTNSTDATFSFTSSEPGSSFDCKLDGGDFTPCSSPQTYGGLSQVSHTFAVRATDPAGNIDQSEATRSWTVDTTAPDTTISGGPTGSTKINTPSFTFSSDDPNAILECKLDGPGAATGTFAACASPKSYGPLGDGAYTFSVRAKDGAGNTDPSPPTRSFAVDTTAPSATVTSGPSGPTNTDSAAFGFSSNENGVSFECRVDGDVIDYEACTSPKAYTGISDGSHTFRVRATDQAGNVGSAGSRSFTVDTTPPDTTIDSGPSGQTGDETPTFSFSSTGGGVSFECRVDTAAFAPCSSPYTTAALTDDPHNFDVRAKDAAGNVDPSPASRSFTVDTVAPNTFINSGPAGPTSDTTPTFTFNSDESGSTFQCELDGPGATTGAYVSCSGSKSYGPLGDGDYTFSVRASDSQGHTDLSPATQAFRVDIVAPQTTIDTGPPSPTNATTAAFTFHSSETGSTFQCKLDGQAFGSCPSSGVSYAGLADGSHTFRVKATDQAGNTDATEAISNWIVDTVAPDAFFTSGPTGPTNDNTPTFAFSSHETGASFECRLDAAAPFSACSSPYTPTSALVDGPHALRIRAKDGAGNVTVPTVPRAFSVDTVRPDTLIDTKPSSITNSTSATFAFHATESGSSFECKLDAQDWGACASPADYGSLSDSSHTFRVRATDQAGNTDQSEAPWTWRVDTTLPQTTITSNPPSVTNSTEATFAFSSSADDATFQCRLDDAANWENCASPKAYSGLSEGAHRFQVRAIDSANNVDPEAAESDWSIDLQPPETTITAGPSGSSASQFASFSFSSPDPTATFECRLDGGDWGTCSSPKLYGDLALRSHGFDVRAIDGAGNRDPSPASQSWAVVAPAPPAAPVTQSSGPRLLSPFPIVRISGTFTSRGVKFRRFMVVAPTGSRVTVSCRGRHCPFRRQTRTTSTGKNQNRLTSSIRVRRLERRLLRAGSFVRVFVTKAGTVGKYTSLRIRRGRPPARVDSCVMPGSAKAIHCPPAS